MGPPAAVRQVDYDHDQNQSFDGWRTDGSEQQEDERRPSTNAEEDQRAAAYSEQEQGREIGEQTDGEDDAVPSYMMAHTNSGRSCLPADTSNSPLVGLEMLDQDVRAFQSAPPPPIQNRGLRTPTYPVTIGFDRLGEDEPSNGFTISALVDSGSAVTLLSEELVDFISSKDPKEYGTVQNIRRGTEMLRVRMAGPRRDAKVNNFGRMRLANGSIVPAPDRLDGVTVRIDGMEGKIDCFLMRPEALAPNQMLLGWNDSQRFNFCTRGPNDWPL